ncbi:hypothetical protein TraAM80_07344 [Trypanosoma rangeli]|uniref:Uncharacterized protein n=1 Tax=Trypanosoma rangeli TaxID=5698 RepID=A0A3R7LPJ8_TRYRA|nr:uncharacterized protein TraAM80_07344 [Trypanosoma rangeli]RNF00944.1 hypothetical protein TraAM80_07344 [Trypanosoma rangeli]|eukprot:RNF00944.1 hypothetical protein TraAM80_07344 [Trypanosoma rangeli]
MEPQQTIPQVVEGKKDKAQNLTTARAQALMLRHKENSVMPFTDGGDKTEPSASAEKPHDKDTAEKQRRVTPANVVDLEAKFGMGDTATNDFPGPVAEDEMMDASSLFLPSTVSRVKLSELYHNAVLSIYEGNLSATLENIKEGAMHGHGRLHWLLGILYANGIGVPQSETKAILHYTFAAFENISEAHMALGRRYTDGIGVARSCEDALMHYREAADVVAAKYEGMPDPTERFAEQTAMGVSKKHQHDNSKMLQLLMLRADEGATDALIALGYANFMGIRGVRRNWHQARVYFLDALAKGDVAAYGALGRLYATGDNTTSPVIERDLATAAVYFSQGAKENDSVSLNGMGYLHTIGFFENEDASTTAERRPNFEKAAEFFGESARRGSVEGVYNLGVLLLHGRGVPQDQNAAMERFGVSALRGNLLSIWQLARHEQRRGNCDQATLLYSRVAMFHPIFDRDTDVPYFALSDTSSSLLPSPALLAARTDNMLVQVLELLAMAETGHAASRYDVAQLLDRLPIIEETEDELEDKIFAKSSRPPDRALQVGRGAVWLQWYHNAVPFASSGKTSPTPLPRARLLSQREALNMLRLRLYGMCAHAGNAEANLRLGDFYYHGESQIVGVNMSRALLHYEAAAAKHNSKAYFNLGFMYQLGLGVPGREQFVSVWEALYRIITNTILGSAEEEGSNEGNVSGKLRTAGIQGALLAEEMRLYLAKRYYDRAMEFGSNGSAFAVKLALITLNLQWWWTYFSHQQYGFSKLLQLPMPMTQDIVMTASEISNVMTTVLEPREEREAMQPEQPRQQQQQQQHSTELGILPDEGQIEWRWDDYVFTSSAGLLFLLLLLRHHAA